jgi:hypothetical protein
MWADDKREERREVNVIGQPENEDVLAEEKGNPHETLLGRRVHHMDSIRTRRTHSSIHDVPLLSDCLQPQTHPDTQDWRFDLV